MPIHMAMNEGDEATTERIDIAEKVGGSNPVVNDNPS